MVIKTIQVDVDPATWPNQMVPLPLHGGMRHYNLNMEGALLMLGTLTTPNSLSPASPARYWAQVRYLDALHRTPDLRITSHYADLDPHQKTILSDDFGVAIATKWLADRYGGFKKIVDGRLFMSQYATITKRFRPTKAKVGPTKAPDFVFQDLQGLWHVLECKGTQSGRSTRDQFLGSHNSPAGAIVQKQTIEILAPHAGQRLASGLAISNERTIKNTHLRIIDPTAKPLITISPEEIESAELAANTALVRTSMACNST